jgi:hypothetical protein
MNYVMEETTIDDLPPWKEEQREKRIKEEQRKADAYDEDLNEVIVDKG